MKAQPRNQVGTCQSRTVHKNVAECDPCSDPCTAQEAKRYCPEDPLSSANSTNGEHDSHEIHTDQHRHPGQGRQCAGHDVCVPADPLDDHWQPVKNSGES